MTRPHAQEDDANLSPALRRYRERRDRVNDIDIRHIFELLGGEGNQDGDPLKWKVEGYNIIHKGQSWKNVSTDINKGFGGVPLVRHIKGFEKEGEAVAWLEAALEGELDNDDLKADPNEQASRTVSDFEPPDRLDEVLPEVEGYLVGERGLPPSLIKEQVAAGNLYASRRWDEDKKQYRGFARCVFLGPASAEIRELGKDGFKGCCRGSQTDTSGFRVPMAKAVTENILAMQEAAVDALSYRSLFPGRYTFSTNGVGRFNLQYQLALQAIDSGVGVRLALDADYAGDMASQRIFNALYLREALSRRLQVDPEQVDAWMMSEAVALVEDQPTGPDEEEAPAQSAALATLPGNSPHELFFTNGWQPELPERVAEMVPDPDAKDGKLKRVWKETGRQLPPMIRLSVLRDVHPRMPRGDHWIKVSRAGYEHVINELNVRRDRTPWGKDWNDALRKLGSSYVRAYEKAARTGFAEGVPGLPVELESIRTPAATPVQPISAEPTPVAAPALAQSAAHAAAQVSPQPAPSGVGRRRPQRFPVR